MTRSPSPVAALTSVGAYLRFNRVLFDVGEGLTSGRELAPLHADGLAVAKAVRRESQRARSLALKVRGRGAFSS
jgi:hypothetical protein